MKRLLLRYRRPGDDEQTVRSMVTPPDYVLVIGRSSTPVYIAVTELVAVELVGDSPPEASDG